MFDLFFSTIKNVMQMRSASVACNNNLIENKSIQQEDTLFDEKYLSVEVQKNLPEGYKLNALKSNDFERGYLEVLKVLTEVGDHTINTWNEQYSFFKKHNDTYYVITITDEKTDKIVATGTILVERKFVHRNGLVGHIEDIAVDANQQGKKLGLRIIEALKYIGNSTGCYKVILDCSTKNVPFYEKCGFSQKENQMAWYIPQTDSHL